MPNTDVRYSESLDTLAAAYADAGMWKEAVEAQQRAISMLSAGVAGEVVDH